MLVKKKSDRKDPNRKTEEEKEFPKSNTAKQHDDDDDKITGEVTQSQGFFPVSKSSSWQIGGSQLQTSRSDI